MWLWKRTGASRCSHMPSSVAAITLTLLSNLSKWSCQREHLTLHLANAAALLSNPPPPSTASILKATPRQPPENMTTNENQSISGRGSRVEGEVNNERGGSLLKVYDIPVWVEVGACRVEWPLMFHSGPRTPLSLVDWPIKGHPEHLTAGPASADPPLPPRLLPASTMPAAL